VLNPLYYGQTTSPNPMSASSGNLNWSYNRSTSGNTWIMGSISIPSSGKFYWEVSTTAWTGGGVASGIEVGVAAFTQSMTATTLTNIRTYFGNTGTKNSNNSYSAYGATFTTNDVVGVALDMDAGTLTFYKNNVSQGTAFTDLVSSGITWCPVLFTVSQNTGSGWINFGQRPFSYTPPTGFNALNTYNLPTPSIANGAQYMAATTYTGTGASQTISNGGNNTIGTTFAPDFIWLKSRSLAVDHALMNTVVGATYGLSSNNTSAEFNQSANFSSFNSNGFTVQGTSSSYNQNAATYAAWQWKAGGTGVTNTSGTITSTVSANTTAGFSVVTYTGTGANATVGHGLGVAPSMIIGKVRSTANDWPVYHASVGAGSVLALDLTSAATAGSTYWNNTAPTSSVFSVGSSATTNQSGQTFVYYCFAAVSGYSSMGSFVGNGSSDGPFVFTNFRPRWILIKRTDTTGSWYIFDSSRNAYNLTDLSLYPNLSDAESASTTHCVDLLSNGFKMRGTGANINASGGTYVWAAFCENPFKYSRGR
jgi:hypothetical protein